MTDFKEPKEFAFGDLNPIQKPRTSPVADPNSISVLDALKEVVTAHYTPDATKGTGPYKGIVLRKEEDFDQNEPAPGNWLATVFGKQGMFEGLFTAPKKLLRYKIRIPELHATLPIPQKFATSTTETGDHQRIINMYPTFVAHDSNADNAEAGDLVWVDFGNKENFEDPTYIGMVFPPPLSVKVGGGGGNPSSQNSFKNCGGGSGLNHGGGGGSLKKPTTAPVNHESSKYKNTMYYSPPKIVYDINKKDPMWHVKGRDTSRFKHIKKYVESGGSGRAVTGKIAPGSCAGMKNELAKWLTAMRIATEDQSQRGYQMGGKTTNPADGGIDCSGFVKLIRRMMEHLIYPPDKLTGEGPSGGYGINNTYPYWKGMNTVKHYTHYSRSSAPHYGVSSGRMKESPLLVPDGWDWVNVLGLIKDGKNVSDANFYKNFIARARKKEFGEFSDQPVHMLELGFNNFHIMPGDEIMHAHLPGKKPSGPSPHGEGALGLTHIMMTFVDPDGNLRLSESGGPFTGTGSRPIEEYLYQIQKEGRRAYIAQKPEWSWLWAQFGGRPNEPWTPELCRRLAGDEYFSIPNLASQATGSSTTVEVNNGDGTSAERDANAPEKKEEKTAENPKEEKTPEGGKEPPEKTSGEGATPAEGETKKPEKPSPPPQPKITAQNITIDQAKAAASSKAEQDELAALPKDATSEKIAETAAGKKVIAKSLEEAKAAAKKSTSAANSTAAQNQTSSAGVSPVTNSGCTAGGGGNSISGGGEGVSEYDTEGNRTGRALGGMPNLAEYGSIKFKMKRIRHDKAGANKFHKTQHQGYGDALSYATVTRHRQDVVKNFSAMKNVLDELGCIVSSSGGGRSLMTKANPPNSSQTSFHYTNLAHDMLGRGITRMPDTTDLIVCELDPVDPKSLICWVKCTKTSGVAERKGVKFPIEHKTIQAVHRGPNGKKGNPPMITPVTGYFVNLTRIMNAYGMNRIQTLSGWRKNTRNASEAWHFDFRQNGGLKKWSTTFGQVVGTMFSKSQLEGKAVTPYLGRKWTGKGFSDARLKKNISRIGSSPSGIPIYKFTYKDSPDIFYEGAIAQDIISSHPEAVVTAPNGYYMIDYNLIDVEFKVSEEK